MHGRSITRNYLTKNFIGIAIICLWKTPWEVQLYELTEAICQNLGKFRQRVSLVFWMKCWKKAKEGERRRKKAKEGKRRRKKAKEGERRRKKAKEGERRRKKAKEGKRRQKKAKEAGLEHFTELFNHIVKEEKVSGNWERSIIITVKEMLWRGRLHQMEVFDWEIHQGICQHWWNAVWLHIWERTHWCDIYHKWRKGFSEKRMIWHSHFLI